MARSRAPAKGLREATVEAHLVREVERLGGVCPKSERMGRGYPDRMVMLPGAVLAFVETKSPTGRVRPLQARMHAMLRALDFRVDVPRTKAEVDEILRSLVE